MEPSYIQSIKKRVHKMTAVAKLTKKVKPSIIHLRRALIKQTKAVYNKTSVL